MTKPKKKSVKAWAIVDDKGLLIAEVTKPILCQLHFGSGRVSSSESIKIVPCTITYDLPTKRTKKS